MPTGFDLTKPHDIEISVVGNSHVIKVDGEQVLAFTEGKYAEGSVGLRTWANTTVQVDNVTITKP